ncbi:acetoacetate--CoA ligase [Amycolatopsis pithecellobii]|uniref:Acetoacetate--CoA ligase n=1 Tax=Amycolatopsis pithecellobii TaxID=664692 RepID=A0A6N7YUM7_9PSEU|nr:acetoacetate--CoA ligase [Amycolatopsis pithecellobii]MTD55628.1 acetoacetate--CoA ligase [Amycolatopsis pithecellobii]
MSRPAFRLADFAGFASRRTSLDLNDYQRLWAWSVSDLTAFWGSVWDFFGLPARSPGEPVLADDRMPGAVWFPDTALNFTTEVFRNRRPTDVALIAVSETGPDTTLTWAELETQVAAAATGLAELGVGHNDTVVAYLPNGVEAVVAFLAAASLGAIWGLCGTDYAPGAAAARLAQLRPKVLIAATGHTHAGRAHDDSAGVDELRAALPGLEHLVLVGETSAAFDGHVITWSDLTADRTGTLEPVLLPFDHPLWVLFSSGTTGIPKGIMHGHGGVVLEHLKLNALHLDLGPGDRMLWYTTPSWMMWNALVSCLLVGAAIICVDGSPAHPRVDQLWAIAARTEATVLGTSPAYLSACRRAEVNVRGHHLAALRTVGVTGSTFSAGLFSWLANQIAPAARIAVTSGGTDVVTAFAGPSPWLEVRPGELSGPCLGVALEAVDPDGAPVRDTVGELVVTRPMPSMPLGFWDDPGGGRLHAAYFSTYPGIWRHGDWITVTGRGSVVIHGRSDATLNRRGIRIGSADIYAIVEALPYVREALVVGVEEPHDGYWMPMFVATADDVELTDHWKAEIRSAIATGASPRHVPDDIVQVPAIPHTRTGKKLEVPIKRILGGESPESVLDPTSVDAAESLTFFHDLGIARAHHRSD